MTQPVIFISYSRKDEREKERLLSHLGVLQHQGLVDLWSDDRLGVGVDWRQKIGEAMAQARVAILLISANFLTSDFVLNEEVPSLIKRREAEGLTIFPMIARACAWQQVDWLSSMQVRPKNGRPIWGASRRVDEDLATIAEEVAALVEADIPPTPTETGLYENAGSISTLAGKPSRIIIIDDDEDWCQQIGGHIKLLNYDPDVAYNFEEVKLKLKRAEEENKPFAVATIDMKFEVGRDRTISLQGEQILEYIKSEYPHIACIVISSLPVVAHEILDLRDDYDLDYYISKDKLTKRTLADAIGKAVRRVKLLGNREVRANHSPSN